MTDDSTKPSVSVIIPAYERVEPLKYTLRSAAASIANSGYAGEIIVVDDGSEPSVEEQLAGGEKKGGQEPVISSRETKQMTTLDLRGQRAEGEERILIEGAES